jgi:Bacterial extracellular solute-binding protein
MALQKNGREKVMLGNWLRGFIAAAAIASAPAAVSAQEIKFWTLSFDNPGVTKAYETIIKDFEAANPGVTIKLENRGTDEHKSALRVAAGSDQAPDIYFMWAGLGLGGEFIKSGLALPMDKILFPVRVGRCVYRASPLLFQAISRRSLRRPFNVSRGSDLLQQSVVSEGWRHKRAKDL